MTKKGESISMSVIIIAAIALLVLVVLAVLVLRAGTGVGTGTGCEGVGGQCTDSDSCDTGFTQDITRRGKLGGCDTGEICCVRVMNERSDDY